MQPHTIATALNRGRYMDRAQQDQYSQSGSCASTSAPAIMLAARAKRLIVLSRPGERTTVSSQRREVPATANPEYRLHKHAHFCSVGALSSRLSLASATVYSRVLCCKYVTTPKCVRFRASYAQPLTPPPREADTPNVALSTDPNMATAQSPTYPYYSGQGHEMSHYSQAPPQNYGPWPGYGQPQSMAYSSPSAHHSVGSPVSAGPQRPGQVRIMHCLPVVGRVPIATMLADLAKQVYSFVPIPGAQQHKRPRRRFEEIDRMYKCGFQGCEKAYGTLNHLNAHVTMQSHGTKRCPEGKRIPFSVWLPSVLGRRETTNVVRGISFTRLWHACYTACTSCA